MAHAGDGPEVEGMAGRLQGLPFGILRPASPVRGSKACKALADDLPAAGSDMDIARLPFPIGIFAMVFPDER